MIDIGAGHGMQLQSVACSPHGVGPPSAGSNRDRRLCCDSAPKTDSLVAREESSPDVRVRLPEVGIEEMADHVARFSLGGIGEIRRQIERRKP